MTDPDHSAGWYSDETATLGDRLTGAREAAGLTQAALAERLGIRTKTVANWEGDVSEPRGSRMQMLAGLLGVSLMWLLSGQGEGVAEPDTAPNAAAANAVLAETGRIRRDIGKLSDRLGRLESQIKLALMKAT